MTFFPEPGGMKIQADYGLPSSSVLFSVNDASEECYCTILIQVELFASS